jgi:hypothetical protein
MKMIKVLSRQFTPKILEKTYAIMEERTFMPGEIIFKEN